MSCRIWVPFFLHSSSSLFFPAACNHSPAPPGPCRPPGIPGHPCAAARPPHWCRCADNWAAPSSRRRFAGPVWASGSGGWSGGCPDTWGWGGQVRSGQARSGQLPVAAGTRCFFTYLLLMLAFSSLSRTPWGCKFSRSTSRSAGLSQTNLEAQRTTVSTRMKSYKLQQQQIVMVVIDDNKYDYGCSSRSSTTL